MKKTFIASLFAVLAFALPLRAQTNIILDGTSGTNTSSTSYSTTGGLNLSLGFFADYLVVAGGGGGGGATSTLRGAGGGGAGGALRGATNLVSSNYSVVVGNGGARGENSITASRQGQNGDNSIFGQLTAIGGGGGGAGNNNAQNSGNTGGSGGGAGGGGNNDVTSAAGGGGSTGQGRSGGDSVNNTDSNPNGRSDNRWAGGGGGGAGGFGVDGNQAPNNDGFARGGNGGNGISNTITGSSVAYAGGGGGGALATATFGSPDSIAGTGGSGGGGDGSSTGSADNGVNGRGGGGGGSGASGNGGNGGSGVVIVRYQGASLGNIGGTVTSGAGTATGYTIHTFANTGSANFNMSSVNMNARLGATASGNLTGNGNLTFSGPGRLSLAGTNTYTGNTAVTSGTLAINGNNSAATGVVTVSSGATLGGSGTIGGQVIVSSGGTLAPGNSPGLMTANDGVSLATGSTFQWELIGNTLDGRGTNYDAVNVTGGSLSIGTGVTSSLVFNASGSGVSWSNSFWDADRSWLVFDNANSPTLASGAVFDTINLSADSLGSTLTSVRTNASFAWNQQGSDVYLSYTAVPEPSTYALLVLAAAALGFHAWRRRRRA
jgi:hypothetical protein